MSNTVDKEAILKKAYEGKLYSCPGDDEIRQAMESYSSELRKENIELKRAVLAGLKKESELQSTNEATQKELEYWKQRCEAAEEMIYPLMNKINTNHDIYKLWQSLKNKSI